MNAEHEPAPLPAAATRMLARYVAERQMPADAFARVGRVITAPRTAAPRTAWVAAVVVLAAILLLVIGARLWTGRTAVVGANDPREQAEDHADSSLRGGAIERAPIPIPAELPALAPAPAPAPIAEPVTAPIQRVRPPAEAPIEPAGTMSTMAAERELLAQAWQALTDGDPQRALRIAKRHRDEFASGVLGPEREAITAMARCATADDPAAIADAFARMQPGSVLLRTVREACAARP